MRTAHRRRTEAGQAVVLVAVAMTAILAMLALILMGGTSFWERRHLQELADSAALAGSIQAGGACSLAQAQAVADGARNVLVPQLGTTTSPSISGGCATSGYVVSYSFPSGATASINWPYLGMWNDRVGVVVRDSIGLELPAFVGSTASITGSAVSQASNIKSPSNYAVYAYSNIVCGGASATLIKGSVYVGGTIDTNCAWYVEQLKTGAAQTTVDYGNILVYQTQPSWSRGGGSCAFRSGPVGNAICSDGYEESGHPNASCALNYPGGTAYLDQTQLVAVSGVVPNPSPCPGGRVPPPTWDLTPDPNNSPSAINQNGGPCPVGSASINSASYPQITIAGGRGPAARASNGTAPGTKAVGAPSNSFPDGLWHLFPGCYAWIDVANVPGGVAVLEPGFYHFNGFFVPSGANADPAGVAAGGIAINASNSRLLGQGVTLEFANPSGGASSFSGSEIKPAGANPSACGSGQECFLGADPTSPVGGYSYFSAPCSSLDPALDSRCPTSRVPAWCLKVGKTPAGSDVYDPSCYDVLVWAPPPPGPTPAPIGGALSFKGVESHAWVYGVIQWPGDCGWTANGSSILIGQLVCNTVNIQGGSMSGGPAVQYGRTGKNFITAEPSLIS